MEIQDSSAVSDLLKLERGLYSTGGERLETILKFPKIVEKYSFPSFLKSCFQKLSQCFLDGNNTERSYIVQAIDKSQKHISMVTRLRKI